MELMRRTLFATLASALLLCAQPVFAAIAVQMNLHQMVSGADRVFTGTVIGMSERRVQIGGGELPAVTYRIRVDDSFKGRFEESKGVRFTDVTMLGSIKHVKSGRHPIADFPILQEGTEYLLMIAPPGSAGLTATMGLGQGVFVITRGADGKAAMNQANNAGLFAGMSVGMQDGAAAPYSELASTIRSIVGGAEQ